MKRSEYFSGRMDKSLPMAKKSLHKDGSMKVETFPTVKGTPGKFAADTSI